MTPRSPSAWKRNPIADPEMKHLGVRAHRLKNRSRSRSCCSDSISSASVSLSMSIFMLMIDAPVAVNPPVLHVGTSADQHPAQPCILASGRPGARAFCRTFTSRRCYSRVAFKPAMTPPPLDQQSISRRDRPRRISTPASRRGTHRSADAAAALKTTLAAQSGSR